MFGIAIRRKRRLSTKDESSETTLQKEIEFLPEVKIFESLYLFNLMVYTFDISNLESLI